MNPDGCRWGASERGEVCSSVGERLRVSIDGRGVLLLRARAVRVVEGRDTAAGSARVTRRVSGCCGVVLLSGEPVAACERLVVDSVAGVVSIVTVVVAPAPPWCCA